jgi:DNA-binding transcriptional ArsR family regulator
MLLKTDSTNFKQNAHFFKILSHPARLEILAILRDEEHCVCHLEASLGYRQAYISQQLVVLKNSGIIEETRQGRNIFYKLIDMNAIKVIDSLNLGVRKSTKEKPLPSNKCPCPKCSVSEK